VALTQLVRPGAPVIYGNFLSSMSLRSGAPTFGMPEAAIAYVAVGQLARRLKVPLRCGGSLTASKVADAQAAQESADSLMPALLCGAHFILHAAGWLEGGLVMGYEKFVIDADHLGMMHVFSRGFALDDNGFAMDAFREVGPGKHFLGCAHTMANYRTAFYDPDLADNDSFEQGATPGRRRSTSARPIAGRRCCANTSRRRWTRRRAKRSTTSSRAGRHRWPTPGTDRPLERLRPYASCCGRPDRSFRGEEVMRPAIALLGLVVFAAPAAAFAQGDISTAPGNTVIGEITPVQLAGLFKAKGYTATPGGLDTDGPWVDSVSKGGFNFTVNFYGCTTGKVKECNRLQFRATFTRKSPENDDLMTKYDQNWVFGKAYTNTDGDMVLEYPINLTGGVTIDNLVDNLLLWEDVLGDYTTEINW
jgi:hypothetical protein